MSAYVAGHEVDEIAEAARRAGQAAERVEQTLGLARAAGQDGSRLDGSGYRLARALPPIGPGSWRLALRTLVQPQRHSHAAKLCGWLPRGFVRTDPISELIEAFVPGDWLDHDSYWAVAADYSSGKRVAFGRAGAPPAKVSEAVAASCAIPAFYHPVSINGRRYVDGGICSPSNLDLLRGAELDLVVCLNPMSSLAQASGGSPGDRAAALMRAMVGRRLGHEARKLRDEGTRVTLIQPTADDLDLMGVNIMARARRVEVMQQAKETTARSLRKLPRTELRALAPSVTRAPARAKRAA